MGTLETTSLNLEAFWYRHYRLIFGDSDNGNDSVATPLLNVLAGRWLPVHIIIEVELVHRRFPGPWRADKIAGGYVVRDSNDQAHAYI